MVRTDIEKTNNLVEKVKKPVYRARYLDQSERLNESKIAMLFSGCCLGLQNKYLSMTPDELWIQANLAKENDYFDKKTLLGIAKLLEIRQTYIHKLP